MTKLESEQKIKELYKEIENPRNQKESLNHIQNENPKYLLHPMVKTKPTTPRKVSITKPKDRNKYWISGIL